MIPINNLPRQASQFFRYLADALDISETHYKKAVERYESLGKWLHRENSIVLEYDPEVYPQGSFALGTVIKPINDEDEYDIDLVCELKATKDNLSQKDLKGLVGVEVKDYAEAYSMKEPVKESKRCWTLTYADEASFHMDVLPAIPETDSFKIQLFSLGVNLEYAVSAISITDNTKDNYAYINPDWRSSNPKGYAEWFKSRIKEQYEIRYKKWQESIQASVEQVPAQRIKVPLQRAIQVLKRHRDVMFTGDEENKPISIIITTLAAQIYQNEADLLETITNIINQIPTYLEEREGVVWIPNPVNPNENFADKWEFNPKLKENFIKWINQVKIDLEKALEEKDIWNFGIQLHGSFGENIVNKSLRYFDKENLPSPQRTPLKIEPDYFLVTHRETPPWPRKIQQKLQIRCRYKNKYGSGSGYYENNSTPIPKGYDLYFSTDTNINRPFNVFWQVVNTGNEAREANQLRGNIFHSEIAGVGGLKQKESSQYAGSHLIKCFIVKGSICLAVSEDFIVNIE